MADGEVGKVQSITAKKRSERKKRGSYQSYLYEPEQVIPKETKRRWVYASVDQMPASRTATEEENEVHHLLLSCDGDVDDSDSDCDFGDVDGNAKAADLDNHYDNSDIENDIATDDVDDDNIR